MISAASTKAIISGLKFQLFGLHWMHQVDHKSKLKIVSRSKNPGNFYGQYLNYFNLKSQGKGRMFAQNDILCWGSLMWNPGPEHN